MKPVGRINLIVLIIILMSILSITKEAWSSSMANQPAIVNRQTPINRVADSFAIMGKSPMQKAQILSWRKEQRRVARLKSLQQKRKQRLAAEQRKLQR